MVMIQRAGQGNLAIGNLGLTLRQQVGGFSPASLGLSLWTVGDAGTYQSSGGSAAASDGDVVGEWQDQSGNGRHLTQATASLKPVLKTGANGINGVSVVRGDGTDDYLTNAYNGTALSQVSMAFVVRPLEDVSTDGIIQWANALTSGTPFVLVRRVGTEVRVFVNNGYRYFITHSANTTKAYVLTGDGTTWKLWVNGVAQTNYTGGFANQANASGIYLFNGFDGYVNADVAEFMIRETVFTTQEVSDLSSYFTTKWGL